MEQSNKKDPIAIFKRPATIGDVVIAVVVSEFVYRLLDKLFG